MNAEVNYISEANFDLLIEYIRKHHKCHGYQKEDLIMVLRIAYELGLRPSEVLKSKKEHYNLHPKVLRLRLFRTKREQNGYASIPPRFVPDLVDYLDKKPNGYIIGNKRGDRHYSYNALFQFLKKAGRELNIPALVTPQKETGEKTVGHAFRKSKGKDMYFRGAPISVVSAKLRHSGKDSITQTINYLRLNLADAQAWERDND